MSGWLPKMVLGAKAVSRLVFDSHGILIGSRSSVRIKACRKIQSLSCRGSINQADQ